MLGALKFENKPLRTRWYLSATRYTTKIVLSVGCWDLPFLFLE